MKATFFYSKTQAQIVYSNYDKPKSFIDGREYTELKTMEGYHKSNFEDAIIVKVFHGLPIGDNISGKYYADTSEINDRITLR